MPLMPQYLLRRGIGIFRFFGIRLWPFVRSRFRLITKLKKIVFFFFGGGGGGGLVPVAVCGLRFFQF